MYTTLKNTELLKHSKVNKNAPTCFGLHRNHLQGAKVSAWLKITRLVNSICVKDVQGVVSAMAAYCDLKGVCIVHCVKVCDDALHKSFTQILLTKCVIFSQALTLAP